MRAIIDILKLKKQNKTCLQNKYEDKAPIRLCNFNETDKTISLVCTVIFNKHPRSNPNTICKLNTKQLYSWYSISHKEVIGKVRVRKGHWKSLKDHSKGHIWVY